MSLELQLTENQIRLKTDRYIIRICLGLLNWLNEVEVFAMLFAAAIHDYEHTGTTNTFHQQTRSNLGLFKTRPLIR